MHTGRRPSQCLNNLMANYANFRVLKMDCVVND